MLTKLLKKAHVDKRILALAFEVPISTVDSWENNPPENVVNYLNILARYGIRVYRVKSINPAPPSL